MVRKDPVFEHKTRRMIYNQIVAHPGITYITLKDIFDLNDGTLRYHLDFLVRAEKIKNNIVDGQRTYHPMSERVFVTISNNGQPVRYKLSKTQEQLLNHIKRNPGIHQKELCKKSNLNRFKIRNHVSKLMRLGLVRSTTERNRVCYECITDGHLQYEMVKTLAMKLINGEIDEKTFIELKDKTG